MNAALSTGKTLGHSAELCSLIRIKVHTHTHTASGQGWRETESYCSFISYSCILLNIHAYIQQQAANRLCQVKTMSLLDMSVLFIENQTYILGKNL
jgi:hypothetical protein